MSRRFPLDPLVRLSSPASMSELAARIAGEPYRSRQWARVHRMLYRGRLHGLSPVVADEYANALGFHPAEVWGDDWYAADGESEVA